MTMLRREVKGRFAAGVRGLWIGILVQQEFDDLGVASYISPPLTSVRVPAREMGRRAAKALLEAIRDGSPVGARYVLDTDIIIRKSTAPPGKL